jgi:hypothetical protein
MGESRRAPGLGKVMRVHGGGGSGGERIVDLTNVLSGPTWGWLETVGSKEVIPGGLHGVGSWV